MAAQYTTVTVFVFTDMEDSQLVNGTWSTEPPFPLNGRNQCSDSGEASSPASLLHSTVRMVSAGLPAGDWRVSGAPLTAPASATQRQPPPPAGARTSWKLTTLVPLSA